MSDQTLVIFVCVALGVLALLYAVIGFSTRRSGRFLVVGFGLIALIVGLALLGWMQLLINGVRSLIDWFQRTAPSDTIYWGAGLAIGGLLVVILGRFIPVKSRSELRMARADKELREMDRQRANRRAASTPARPTTTPAPAPAPRPATNDLEIDNIRSRHGL